MEPDLLPWIGEHYDAVIIESYGVGGLPSAPDRDFLKEVDKLIADGKIVVMTTQVMYEGSDMEVYEVGHVAKERYGLIESYDMTLEATVTKLMWIMAQTKIVVMTTLVMYEGRDMAVYEVGLVAKER